MKIKLIILFIKFFSSKIFSKCQCSDETQNDPCDSNVENKGFFSLNRDNSTNPDHQYPKNIHSNHPVRNCWSSYYPVQTDYTQSYLHIQQYIQPIAHSIILLIYFSNAPVIMAVYTSGSSYLIYIHWIL